MPLQNRVLPSGDIVAIPARGTFTGNRGIIHRKDQTLGTSRWTHHAWICCTLDWQGRKRPVMSGRNWTELFFLDEAVALAAGHRPCAYCRRTDYNRFVQAWTAAFGERPRAPQMDRVLHDARIENGTRQQQVSQCALHSLPTGTIINWDGGAHLIADQHLHPYTPQGYGPARTLPPDQIVTVLTPQPSVRVLQAGYTPTCHPTASIDLSPPTA